MLVAPFPSLKDQVLSLLQTAAQAILCLGVCALGSLAWLGRVDREMGAAQALEIRVYCSGRKFLGIAVWPRRETSLGEQEPSPLGFLTP